jgi:hypothetical protein
MNRFDGTAARQLNLMDDDGRAALIAPRVHDYPRPSLRLLKQDVYEVLARRRRRAQIAARRWVEQDHQQ